MVRSTFFGFTTAMRGLSASQKALDVTGQNITNINTPGYTRQRLDLYSSASGGYSDRYSSKQANLVGNGVIMGGVAQMRDPFLDVRFRREASKLGEVDARLTVLKDLTGIFDETMTDGLKVSVEDLVKQLQSLSQNTGSADFDGIVKSSAKTMTKLFNQYSTQVSQIREQSDFQMESVTIPEINSILKNIANLNKSIKEDQSHGNPALELTDQRNLLIDELSSYMKIDVSHENRQEISPGVFVSDLTIKLMGDTGSITTLVSGDKAAELEYSKDATGKTLIGVNNINGTTQDLTDKFVGGIMKGSLDMLNSSGEFDTPPNTNRGIGYYEKVLDTIANEIATAFNTANSFFNPANASVNPAFDPSQPESATNLKYTALDPTFVPGDPANTPPGALYPPGNEWKPLFSDRYGNDPITANGFDLAKGWVNSEYYITNTKSNLPGDNSGAADNVLYMISLFDKPLEFKTPAGVTLFKGTFQEAISQAGNILDLDQNSTQKVFDNYMTVLNGVDDLRSGLSAVSLDEEGVNLMKYQKSYNAAARLMTTLDEALETIINRMGVVGR